MIEKVAVLIPSWNGRNHLQTCLRSLQSIEDPGVEWSIFVFDNGSTDGTREWLEEFHPEVKILYSENNIGFAAAMNRLVDAARDADAVAFLNNDTRVEPSWLAALVDALRSAPPDVAAVSGRIVSWDADFLDFARGIMTFDGHAFQWDYHRPLADLDLPPDGAELLFACGANLLIRRSHFTEVGGFDDDYFAYFEDVDLGWRLWLAGYRILYAHEAVIRHRSMATSELLGQYRRGFLFEKNAFLTTYKNYDEVEFQRLMPAVLWTLMGRAQTLLIHKNPGGSHLRLFPFPTPELSSSNGPPVVDQNPFPAEEISSTSRWQALHNRWREFGPRRFFRRGLAKMASVLLARGGPVMTDPQTVGHLRAISYLMTNLDQAANKRAAVQKMRKRPDREIFERFGLWVVPTYPGDDRLFRGPAFEAWLPEDLRIEKADLSDIMG